MAYIRQSPSDSGIGFQVKVRQKLSSFPLFARTQFGGISVTFGRISVARVKLSGCERRRHVLGPFNVRSAHGNLGGAVSSTPQHPPESAITLIPFSSAATLNSLRHGCGYLVASKAFVSRNPVSGAREALEGGSAAGTSSAPSMYVPRTGIWGDRQVMICVSIGRSWGPVSPARLD